MMAGVLVSTLPNGRCVESQRSYRAKQTKQKNGRNLPNDLTVPGSYRSQQQKYTTHNKQAKQLKINVRSAAVE